MSSMGLANRALGGLNRNISQANTVSLALKKKRHETKTAKRKRNLEAMASFSIK